MKKTHIYYIDDDADDLENMEIAFEQANPKDAVMHLIKNPTQFSATDLLSLSDPSVIILDINMPEKTGIDILKEIRALDGTKKTPVLMFSTGKDPIAMEECKRLGATHYVIKPSFFTSLVKFVHTAIQYEGKVPPGEEDDDFLLQFD